MRFFSAMGLKPKEPHEAVINAIRLVILSAGQERGTVNQIPSVNSSVHGSQTGLAFCGPPRRLSLEVTITTKDSNRRVESVGRGFTPEVLLSGSQMANLRPGWSLKRNGSSKEFLVLCEEGSL